MRLTENNAYAISWARDSCVLLRHTSKTQVCAVLFVFKAHHRTFYMFYSHHIKKLISTILWIQYGKFP